MKIERGSVRRGILTSPPITAHSSSPANAKAIEAQRLSSERSPRSGTSDCAVIGVAAGAGERRVHAERDQHDAGEVGADRAEVLQPLPVRTPTMLSATASQSAASVAGST